jgi:hypothetical protein
VVPWPVSYPVVRTRLGGAPKLQRGVKLQDGDGMTATSCEGVVELPAATTSMACRDSGTSSGSSGSSASPATCLSASGRRGLLLGVDGKAESMTRSGAAACVPKWPVAR